jgi:integrase
VRASARNVHDRRMPRRRRRWGEGSVTFDRTTRSWVARISLGTRNGRRVVRKARASSEEAAKRELERLRRAYLADADPANETLHEYLAAWLRSHGPSVRESTLVSYTGHVELHISPLLGGIPVARLRQTDVRRLIENRLAAGLSPATVRRIHATLHMALERGVDERRLVDNAAAGVRLPRVEPKAVAAMSEDQAAAILAACRGTFLEALVELLLGSGLRLGEALGLDQADVDVEGRFVVVRRSKTTVRAVPISDDAAEALRRHILRLKRIGPREPVFVGPRTHHRLTTTTVSHAFPKLLEAAGLPRLTPHALRHGVATLLVARGMPMRHVAEQLGHRNPALTARVYAHVLPEAQREGVRLLNRKTS